MKIRQAGPAFALLLLALLCYFVGIRQIFHTLASIRLSYILILLFVSFLLILVSCIKWQLFVRATGNQVSVLQLMKYYTMSYFFSMFMPSIVGGDVARSVQLGSRLKNYKDAFAATFVERFTGFLAMNLVGVGFVAGGARVAAGVEWAVLGVAFVTLLGALICFSESLLSRVCRLAIWVLSRLGLARLAPKLQSFLNQISAALRFSQSNSRLFFGAMGYSFLFHFLAVINTYIVALSIGWEGVSFASLCVVVPLVLLVSASPLTPGSVGITEGAFLFFLTRIGATHAQGLGVGLVLRAKNVVIAFVGWILWLLSRGSGRVDD